MTYARGTKLPIILAMANGPEGLTSVAYVERFGGKLEQASGYISKMTESGHLFRSKRKGHPLHWFTTSERAAEWAALPGNLNWVEQRKAAAAKRAEKRAAELAARRAVIAAAPVVTRYTAGPSKAAKPIPGEVDYSRAKLIQDVTPRPAAAYQALRLPPDPRYPAFAGRIGFYDEVTA